MGRRNCGAEAKVEAVFMVVVAERWQVRYQGEYGKVEGSDSNSSR